MFLGPHFVLSTMQEGTTHIFKVFGTTGRSTNWESNPQFSFFLNLLGQCWIPPIVSFYDQQGLLRTNRRQGAPSGAPTSDPHRGLRFIGEAGADLSGCTSYQAGAVWCLGVRHWESLVIPGIGTLGQYQSAGVDPGGGWGVLFGDSQTS